MHADEHAIDEALVRRLLAAQLPQWADWPLHTVPSAGTVNALFRLGDELAVRLPRIAWGSADIPRTWRWLPQLAPLLPLAVPEPVALGAPDGDYPWQWAVFRWLPGVDATRTSIADEQQLAVDLARVIRALWRVSLADGPVSGRGTRLSERADGTRRALAALATSDIDTAAAGALWEACLHTPLWPHAPVWTHGDLIPPNLLLVDGRLQAVIDFGAVGLGDPACDLVPAWGVLSAETRPLFRRLLQVDDDTWQRGRGWALSQALLILPYYRDTNPTLVAVARRTIGELLSDQHRA